MNIFVLQVRNDKNDESLHLTDQIAGTDFAPQIGGNLVKLIKHFKKKTKCNLSRIIYAGDL